MSEQSKPESKRNSSHEGLSVDVGHLSVTGHVVFAGRDGSVNVNTGGDVAQNTENTMTVGGVETTRQSYDEMVSTIEQVEQKFETEEPDEETKEAARYYLETIKKLLLSKDKPNPKILLTAVKSLAKLGPLFIAGISEVFGVPLAAQIIEQMGQGTSGFFKTFMTKFGS